MQNENQILNNKNKMNIILFTFELVPIQHQLT